VQGTEGVLQRSPTHTTAWLAFLGVVIETCPASICTRMRLGENIEYP
jgi:hypothetical protein